MKSLPSLLGIAVGLLAPLAAHAAQTAPAADNNARTKARARRDRVVVTAPAIPRKKQTRVRYEITNMTVVGSHLPVVVYHHKGEIYTGGNSFAPRKAYRREGGLPETSGAANIAGELLSLDPAFH